MRVSLPDFTSLEIAGRVFPTGKGVLLTLAFVSEA